MADDNRKPGLPQIPSALIHAYGGPRAEAEERRRVAREIITRATEAGLYAHGSPELVALLTQLDTDSRIPDELYTAMAEVLMWLQEVDSGSGR